MSYQTPWSSLLDPGNYQIAIIDTTLIYGGQTYNFIGWQDQLPTLQNPRTVALTAGQGISLMAVYQLAGYITPASIPNLTGSHTVTMPSTVNIGGVDYTFLRWEDNTTNPVRIVSMTANKTIMAYYQSPVTPLTVDAGGPYTAQANMPIAFTGNVYGGTPPYTYLWNFGDGTQSPQQNPSHTYVNANTYTASLQVTDSVNAVVSDSTVVTISALPTHNITGVVQDILQAPVADAKVSAQGTNYSTQTLANGTFSLTVPEGIYTILVEKVNYNTVTIQNVDATSGDVPFTNPVTLSSTPVRNDLPLFLVIGVGIFGAGYFLTKRGTKKRSR